MSLQDQRILVGVTGSIAAYKACDLVQRLKEKGAQVRVAMTHGATRLVHPNAFSALTGHPVILDPWADVGDGVMQHIEAARWTTAFVIAPCTAHTLAELSLGLTGSALSMIALAYNGSMMVAPAMNTVMLESPPVQEHLRRLAERGVRVLPTSGGVLACGEEGEGKLLTPEEITAYIEINSAFGSKAPLLSGLRVLISGGHTEEPLDGVRFLSNRSSGKTAIGIARAFRLAGASVHLVLGMADEAAPMGMRVTRVRTSDEFHVTMLQGQKEAEAVIMAAAIADFVPAQAESGKWKNSKSFKNIELHPSKNVLDDLGEKKLKGQVLVGFALETEAPIATAWEKLQVRHCDLMVANNPLARTGLGFGEDGVEAAILDAAKAPAGSEQLVLVQKTRLAVDLVRAVAGKLGQKAA